MDVIKREPEVDPLDLQPHAGAYEAEVNKSLSQEKNLSNLQVGDMKTECMDHSSDLTSRMKVENTSVAFSFAVVKCEVEDPPMPINSPVLKSEIDEDLFHLDRLQQEQKAEVSSEENQIFCERQLSPSR
ncbi:uncharacterized protein [Periplaneta americana]|uniref:uncharacterized protein isoform X6 n=1 Tax=Periplaneta americana TaxID=6978 RepID=UPI0037E7B134